MAGDEQQREQRQAERLRIEQRNEAGQRAAQEHQLDAGQQRRMDELREIIQESAGNTHSFLLAFAAAILKDSVDSIIEWVGFAIDEETGALVLSSLESIVGWGVTAYGVWNFSLQRWVKDVATNRIYSYMGMMVLKGVPGIKQVPLTTIATYLFYRDFRNVVDKAKAELKSLEESQASGRSKR